MTEAEVLELMPSLETVALSVLCCVLDSQRCWSYNHLYQIERVLGGFGISSRGHSPAEAILRHQNKRQRTFQPMGALTIVFMAETIASTHSSCAFRTDEPQVAHTLTVRSDAITTSAAGSGCR